MKIKITPARHISDIQEEFTSAFPYLRIEFFSKSRGTDNLTLKKHQFRDRKTISQLSTKKQEKMLDIKPDMTVMELESLFQEEIGIPAQVFRKSGTSWLETTATDGWSLEKQNHFGEMLSNKSFRFQDDLFRDEFKKTLD